MFLILSFKMVLSKLLLYPVITKVSKLLKGYRGEAPGDIDEVKNTIKRVAKLTLDFDDISELDINPVFVYEEGSSALDIKIKL